MQTETVKPSPLKIMHAHGPQEGPTHAASLDEHERYELPDPLPAAEDCDAVVTIGTVEVLGSYNRHTIAAAKYLAIITAIIVID